MSLAGFRGAIVTRRLGGRKNGRGERYGERKEEGRRWLCPIFLVFCPRTAMGTVAELLGSCNDYRRKQERLFHSASGSGRLVYQSVPRNNIRSD